MANITLEPPVGVAHDCTIPHCWASHIPEEHGTWDTLFARQAELLPGRVTPEFIDGLDMLRLSKPGISDFDELSGRLMKATGWQIVAGPGLVHDDVFFDHLANRRFVSGNFISRPDQLDYLQEPDVSHDVFGHVPLLANPIFADYMQAYGKDGPRATQAGAIDMLSRLYWYTVGFGLVRSRNELKLYGAGIVSSYTESVFALDDSSPNRIGLDLRRLMRTKYRIGDFQQNYFVIDSFEALLDQTLNTDFGPIYEELAGSPDIEIEAILPGDKVDTRGTQSYARGKAAA